MAVSQDYSIALQPGRQSETLFKQMNKQTNKQAPGILMFIFTLFTIAKEGSNPSVHG